MNGTVYTVSLLAGTNVLASTSGTGPEGSFATFSVTFNSNGSSFLGQSLEIVLLTRAQTAFDAIALTGQSSVPEPSAPPPSRLRVSRNSGLEPEVGCAHRRGLNANCE